MNQELILTTWLTDRRYLAISDPPAWTYIVDELLDELLAEGSPFVDFGEGLLRIKGENRTVVYRLDEHDPVRCCWAMTLIRHEEHPS